MPNEPISAEEFAESMRVTFQIGANEGPVYCNKPECQKAEALANIKFRDAQLIASTLQAAADRVCEGCKERAPFETCQEKSATCWTKEAILAPLDKTDNPTPP